MVVEKDKERSRSLFKQDCIFNGRVEVVLLLDNEHSAVVITGRAFPPVITTKAHTYVEAKLDKCVA